MTSAPTWQRGSTDRPQFTFLPGWQDQTPNALVALKERIHPFEATGHWELLKKMVNPFEMVYTHDTPDYHPSIAVIKPLSRSYFKMIEMLDVLDFYALIPKQTHKIRTAHIAEGPGGFIQAVVETVDRHHKILSQATAMTLKPVDSRVPGWRRATTFLQKNRNVKLHYGADSTGDIYNLDNQASFVKEATPGTALFTADGGFDFSVNYKLQEQNVFHLLVCSALIGVQTLNQDGAMVIKLFDLYSDATKALIATLSRNFREWQIYKPAMSRPCNSEHYFLGRGFRGLQPERLAALQTLFEHSLKKEYPTMTLSADEALHLNTTAADSTARQMRSLERALYYSTHLDDWYKNQLPKDFQTSLGWCHKYRIPTPRTAPAQIVAPLQTISLPSPSQEDAAPQSPKPGAESVSLVPSGQASQASSAGFVYHILAPSGFRIVVDMLD